jgi:hypothetical protein
MTKGEQEVIRNVIEKLRGGRAAPKAREALTGPARLYLETWVIGSLQLLLPESRDVSLARKMSR